MTPPRPLRRRLGTSRRRFLAATAGGAAALALPRPAPAADAPRKKVALLGTVCYTHSHTQHFLDRLAMGYAWGGGWQAPRVDLVSVYLDQFPESDSGRARLKKYGIEAAPSIEAALTRGGGELAVDGVVVIGEHGSYPVNEKGQTRYPRHAWFKEIVKVFEATGRSVPVFNDKHLSTVWDECAEMVADSRRLDFPFLAGSSLPVTLREPAIDMPTDAPLVESVCVGYGGPDSYDFHALETAQCMSERRRGGEVGIRSVHALKGPPLWEALAVPDREATRRLVVAALTRSHNLPVDGGYPTAPVTFDWAREALASTTGYLIEHRDGFRTTMLLAPIQDFNYAGLRSDTDEIVSCQMVLPMPGHGATTADFFTPLVRHIETMVIERRAPYPVERTLLTSGMVIAGVDSLHAGTRIETPAMEVRYAGPRESTFWRA